MTPVLASKALTSWLDGLLVLPAVDGDVAVGHRGDVRRGARGGAGAAPGGGGVRAAGAEPQRQRGHQGQGRPTSHVVHLPIGVFGRVETGVRQR